MDNQHYILLGTTLFFGLLSFAAIGLGLYRRKQMIEDHEKELDEIEKTFRECSQDNTRVVEEAGKLASNLISFFFTYQRWRSTRKDSYRRSDVELELAVLWFELPEDARKLLFKIAEPAGLHLGTA